MDNQEAIQRRAVVGTLRGEGEVADLRDPWAEAPFYGAGEGSDTVSGLAAGDTIAAIFHGLRVGNKKGPASKQRDYAVLQTEAGDRLRLFTPANLKGQLRNKETGEYRVQPGTYVEITYLGMEVVEGVNDDKPIHQWNLKIGKEALN